MDNISEESRSDALDGVGAVLSPHGLTLERLATVEGGRGIPGVSQAVYQSGGGNRPGTVLVRADIVRTPEHAREVAAEQHRLWLKDKSPTNTATRGAVWHDSEKPIASITAHESAHELFYQRTTPRQWSSAMRSAGVTLQDRLAVSEYAAQRPIELFAEAQAMEATGRKIPASIQKALTLTIKPR